jgi:hypothetical protein
VDAVAVRTLSISRPISRLTRRCGPSDGSVG